MAPLPARAAPGPAVGLHPRIAACGAVAGAVAGARRRQRRRFEGERREHRQSKAPPDDRVVALAAVGRGASHAKGKRALLAPRAGVACVAARRKHCALIG